MDPINSNTSSLFSTLYPDVFSKVVEYCDAKSISNLDRAATCHSHRDLFLSCISRACKEAFEIYEHGQNLSLQYTCKRSMWKIKSIRISRHVRNIAQYNDLLENLGPNKHNSCSWQRFSFKGCQINDNHLVALSEAVGGHLTALDLSMCQEISDAGIKKLTSCTPGISELDLSVTHKSLVTDATLRGLATCAHQLHTLRLSHCYSVTNVGLCALVSGCHFLETLDLTWCSKISDTALLAIAAAPCATTLQDISLSDCTKISNRGVIAIANSCPNIMKMVLNYCHRLSDASIIALAHGCKRLSVLDLNNCVALTDGAVEALADYCTDLESLKLANNKHITDKSCLALTACLKLRRLTLFECPLITSVGRCAIVQGCQHLRGKDYDRVRNSLGILERFTKSSRKRSDRSLSPDQRSWRISDVSGLRENGV